MVFDFWVDHAERAHSWDCLLEAVAGLPVGTALRSPNPGLPGRPQSPVSAHP
ncbi:MAG: hypothetical protein J0G97_19825 [Rhizobium pusense]|nr:hypothetical protein [Agrobacterium pusense]